MADVEVQQRFSAATLRRNWHFTSVVFGINHGCATTPLIFATTLLDKDVGYTGSALLYVFTCLGSLFVSVPFVSSLGQRWGLFFGMAVYCLYVASFAAAAAVPKGSWEQWAFFLPGSCAGGIAASVLWTAQGSYIDRHATALVASSGGELDRQQATASLASTFAVYYLLLEVVCKLGASIALRYQVQTWLIFTVSLVLASTAAAASLWVRTLGPTADAASAAANPTLELGSRKPQVCGKLLKATALWSDPSLWLLSLTNLTFGFAAAFMNGYVNAAYTKPQLGAEWVGFYATATALTGAVASHFFGMAARHFGSKGPFILVGSLCFLAIPALVLFVGLDDWQYWLVVPYVLQGCGRAVYESTSKGVFADFFPGDKAEGAFANSMMQTTLAFAFCFFFSSVLPREALAAIVFALAGLTFPAYLQARRLRQRQQSSEKEGSGNSEEFSEEESTATADFDSEDSQAR
mmetsp:Transcript_77265/g.203410  ORF Transcript_77265/g.203410 Transcript_77265/m.203410 type:complete len:464 (-) Transcript_77265:59-1450(-)